MSTQPASSIGPFSIALKRRMYLFGLAVGFVLGLLYSLSIAQEGIGPALLATALIMTEVLAFLLLFALAPGQTSRLEAPFHFIMVASLLAFGAAQIFIQYAAQNLSPDKLGFLLNSLVLWVTFFLLGALLALPFQHVRHLLILIWVGMGLLTLVAIGVMRPPAVWRYSYILAWFVSLAEITLASTMLLWLGQHQRRHATTDALTGVANRHQITDRLMERYTRAVAQGKPFTLMLIDIDHFKQINDRFGHMVGDQVLLEVAATIAQHIRINDDVGRWGGDEFLVLLGTGPAEAAQVAERIVAAMGRPPSSSLPMPTLSIGIYPYEAGLSVADMLAAADQGLYMAKAGGRNQVGLLAPGSEG